MSVFQTLFGNKPAQAQQPQQQQQASQQPASQHVQANNQVPQQSNSPVQQPTPENPNPQSPNAEFGDLWSTVAQQQNQGPNFKLDPAKLNEHLSKADFTAAISRENAAKIMAGGEDAVTAMMTMLNEFGREVFSKAAGFSSNLAESSYTHATSTMQRGLPDLVTKQLSQQELFTANPKLRDPALQPMVQAIQSQVQSKHPNATPSEVNAMVNRYFSDHVVKAFTPDSAQQNNQGQAKTADDFSSFLG